MNMRKKKKKLKNLKHFLTDIGWLHVDGTLVFPGMEDGRRCGRTGFIFYVICLQYEYVKLMKETTPKWRNV